MLPVSLKNIESEAHPQTKMLFWFLFGSSRGAPTRVRIINLLRKFPFNAHQASKELSMDYKAIKHHIDILIKNNLIEKFDSTYGASYFLSGLFEENKSIFDEIASKMEY